MATKKRLTKVVNKNARKQPSKTSFFSSSLFFKFIIFFGFLAVLYSQKSVFLRYLGFSTDKIVYAEARSMPIEKVLDTHIEKSFGIDISEYQDKINWNDVKEIEGGYPIEFVFIRATAGSNKKIKSLLNIGKQLKKKNLFVALIIIIAPMKTLFNKLIILSKM